MGHTAPDWSWMGKVSTIYALQDMAELAARLGSPVTFDRRGNVIWFDDFSEGTHGWTAIPLGGGAAASLAVEHTLLSPYSYKLTAGNSTPWTCTLLRSMPITRPTKVGIEVIARYSTAKGTFDIGLDYYLDNEQYPWRARIDPSTPTLLQVYHAGDYVTVKEYPRWYASPEPFFTLKLVIDLEDLSYERLIFNKDEVDVSAYAATAAGYTGLDMLRIALTLTSGGAWNPDIWVSGVILTQNEP